jgi:hypothetical protein
VTVTLGQLCRYRTSTSTHQSSAGDCNNAITVPECAKFLGQPVQYGIGCGSQLSILVVLDHSKKQAPPGVIENYVGWLQPALHGRTDARYPSMVGVLIINTNLPVPSTWSRLGNAVATVPVAGGGYHLS